MNKIYNPKPENWASLLERPTKTVDDIEATVKEISISGGMVNAARAVEYLMKK